MLDFDLKTLKVENVDLNGRLKMVLSKLDIAKASLNARSGKLYDILSNQKANTDKHSIGYTDGASTSIAKGTNFLVKSLVVTNPTFDIEHRAAEKKNVSLLNVFPLVIIVELNDTFDPIAIGYGVH